MSEPNISIGFTARVLGAEGPIAAGDALVYDPTYSLDGVLGVWRIASAANRTASSAGTDAIALTAYGGAAVGLISYQASGVVATEISGLAALTPTPTNKLVRISTAGRLERIDAYTAGDDVVGFARWNGRVALHIGLPWSLIAALGGIAALPDYSIQYRKPDGTLGGAAHAGISTDGYIETRAASEAVATTGHWRTGYGISGSLIRGRDVGGVDRNILTGISLFGITLGSTPIGTNVVGDFVLINGQNVGVVLRVGNLDKIDIGTDHVATFVPRIGASTPWGASEGEVAVGAVGTYSLTTAEYPLVSLLFTGAGTGTYTIPPPTNSGYSYLKVLTETQGYDRVITIGSGTTYTLRANTCVWVKVTTSGVFEIGAGSGDGGASLTVAATTANINLGSGASRITTIILTTSGEVDNNLTTIVAPAAGRSGFVRIINEAGPNGHIKHNSGATAANRITVPGGVDFSFTDIGTVYLAYSEVSSRWIMGGPPT